MALKIFILQYILVIIILRKYMVHLLMEHGSIQIIMSNLGHGLMLLLTRGSLTIIVITILDGETQEPSGKMG
ncbi:hypothetical protein HMPREF1548_02093 [Clostridium sp. KLE 1755]|nr:hypothetical protein HMPREF1548_02093 [Clostridium sp. KLE 1755]